MLLIAIMRACRKKILNWVFVVGGRSLGQYDKHYDTLEQTHFDNVQNIQLFIRFLTLNSAIMYLSTADRF